MDSAAALRRAIGGTAGGTAGSLGERPGESAVPVLTPRGHVLFSLITCGWGTYFGLTYVGFPEMLSACWMYQAAIFLTLAIFGPLGRRSPTLWRALGGMTAMYVVGGLAAGYGLGRLTWMAATNALGAAIGVWLYRRDPQRSWVPRDLSELLWLWTAAALPAVVTEILGGFPYLGAATDPPLGDHVWSIIRQVVILTTAVNCLLPVFFRAGSQLLPPLRKSWWGPYAVFTVACLWATYQWPDLPVSWVGVIPAVVAGALMTRRAAALTVLVICVAAIGVPYPEYVLEPLLGVLHPAVGVDMVLALMSDLTMMMVVFREWGAHLVTTYRALAGSSRAHREVRDAVLDAMSDGLLLTDDRGRVLLSNAALTGLLGQGPPEIVSLAWARQVNLQTADVERILGAREFARLVRPRAGGVSRSALVVPAGPAAPAGPQASDGPAGAGVRRLAVTTQDLLVGQDGFTLWLFKDVTAAHEQARVLEDFAGRVAGDLKAPLVALATWMDTADDELAGDQAEAGQYAMTQAQDAIDRMRGLIDDYLSQAVGRGGALTLTDVRLADVVREICAAYAAGAAGAEFDVEVEHTIHADAALTRQLFANVIGAGVRNHPPGRSPYVVVRSMDEAPGWAEVSIADRGAGAWWEGDGQADPGSSSPTPNLTICRAIVARHGGHIGTELNAWGGATVRFTLPLAAPEQAFP